MTEYKEYGVGIYPDDLDRRFDELDEAQDACETPYFHGLDCYIYGIDRYGSRRYIPFHQQAGDYANGMGCLAAQIVAKFKPGLGGAYIVPVGQCEEFNYTLSEENGLVMVSVTSYDGVLFEGPLSEMPI